MDFFIFRSFEIGIFRPFLVPADFRSLPRFFFLMWMRLRRLRAIYFFRFFLRRDLLPYFFVQRFAIFGCFAYM